MCLPSNALPMERAKLPALEVTLNLEARSGGKVFPDVPLIYSNAEAQESLRAMSKAVPRQLQY